MLRASMTTLLCYGVAAQDVSLFGTPCDRTRADQAVGQPYGSATLTIVANWLAQPQADYFHVPDFESGSLVLTPEAVLPLGRGAAELQFGLSTGCGRGWAKLETGTSVCRNDLQSLQQPHRTNKITQGDNFKDIPVYVGASRCQGGNHRFNIDVKFEGTTITVDLSNGGRNSLAAAHLYVGRAQLPQTGGQYEQFPVTVGAQDDPVVTFDDLDAGQDYWFAIYMNVACRLVAIPECPSTFYVTQYNCGHGPCTAGISGNLAGLLIEDGWSAVRAFGVCFTESGTGDYAHETRVFAKEISEQTTTPTTEGMTRYVGVFATGCGESVVPPPPSQNPGPVRALCKDNCPRGSQGFSGISVNVPPVSSPLFFFR